MLKIKIELWPCGLQKDARVIGTGNIINDGSGNLEVGNYTFEFVDDFGKLASGKVQGYLRGNQVWKLLYLALQQVFEKQE
jgi:hypothetical protein